MRDTDINRVNLTKARATLITLGVPGAATADEITLRVILATSLATNLARLCTSCAQAVLPPDTDLCADCELIAELQRAQRILDAARRRDPYAPNSGEPGFDGWARRTLAAAGLPYIIINGTRVPIG